MNRTEFLCVDGIPEISEFVRVNIVRTGIGGLFQRSLIPFIHAPAEGIIADSHQPERNKQDAADDQGIEFDLYADSSRLPFHPHPPSPLFRRAAGITQSSEYPETR